MYSHVQLNEQGKFMRLIPANQNIAWDANNYCTAFALEKDGKAENFNVVKFFTAAQPAFNLTTQKVREADPICVNGNWIQQWEIVSLDKEAAAEKIEIITKEVIEATQQRLDAWANTRNYDGILSLCTYTASTVPKFQAEGRCGVEARDVTWARLYELLAEVDAGTRPMPGGFGDLKNELPILQWPIQPE